MAMVIGGEQGRGLASGVRPVDQYAAERQAAANNDSLTGQLQRLEGLVAAVAEVLNDARQVTLGVISIQSQIAGSIENVTGHREVPPVGPPPQNERPTLIARLNGINDVLVGVVDQLRDQQHATMARIQQVREAL